MVGLERGDEPPIFGERGHDEQQDGGSPADRIVRRAGSNNSH
jgi:hypothetical protein